MTARALRVGMLTTSFPLFPNDRAGNFVYAFCRELAKRGHDVTVTAPHHPGAHPRERWDGIAIERFRYFHPASLQRVAYRGGTPSNLRGSWIARLQLPVFVASFWWRARRLARRSEILHAHWVPSGVVGLLAFPFSKPIPIVLSVWGSDLLLMKTRFVGGLVRRMVRKMDAVLAVSRAMKTELVGLGIPEAKVFVVMSATAPVPRPSLEGGALRASLGLPLDRTIALYLGRLSSEKGPQHLLEAARTVLAAAPETYFVLVGDGGLAGELEAQARALGIEKSVRLAGYVPHDRIGDWLAASDLLVLPSLSEGLPHAVLEAMAFELPVVATAVGGVPEVVRDGVTGFLVPAGDARAFAQRVIRLVRDTALGKRFGEAGGLRLRELELNWERYTNEVLAVYALLSGC